MVAMFWKIRDLNREEPKERAKQSLFRSGYWVALAIMFVLATVEPGIVAAQLPAEQQLQGSLIQGIDLTLKQEYSEAKDVFKSVIINNPDNPAGYLYLAGTIQAEYSDYENVFDQQLFDSLLAKGEILAEHLIERKDSADWGYYFAGTAISYRAFSESENGGWPNAIIDGMNAAKMFERCLDLNPLFYDAMNGLGTYYYWRSKKTEFLSWLPFIHDRKKEGIALLSSACEKGTYERFVAMNSLVLVFTEEERYDEAFSTVMKALEVYPDNRSFLWCLVGIVERMPHKDTAAVRSAVSRLLASVMKAPVRNPYSEATCRLKIAQFAMEEGRTSAVIDECSAILRYEQMEGKTKRDIGKKITAAKVLLQRAKESQNSEKLKVNSGK